ncbi:MAG TPA: hypothetical protein VK738_15120 [Terriglobales bacterium]|nr:hypothetical protein [Terriglobales bacterium]
MLEGSRRHLRAHAYITLRLADTLDFIDQSTRIELLGWSFFTDPLNNFTTAVNDLAFPNPSP